MSLGRLKARIEKLEKEAELRSQTNSATWCSIRTLAEQKQWLYERYSGWKLKALIAEAERDDLRRQLEQAQDNLHKCDGMANEINLITEAYRKQTEQLEQARQETKALRRNLATYLAPSYAVNPAVIAELCDTILDRSGALLGYVREAAALEPRP